MDQVTFTGVLISVVQIGGDTTGWALQPGRPRDIEVDMSGIAAPERFGNRDVAITGVLRTRSYVERGPVEILVAETLKVVAA